MHEFLGLCYLYFKSQIYEYLIEIKKTQLSSIQ